MVTKQNMSCQYRQHNFICEERYFGETKRRLVYQFTKLLRSTKYNSPGLPVAAHFNSSEHSIFNAKVSGITICVSDTYKKIEEEQII